jgi:predicted transcriptional regulator
MNLQAEKIKIAQTLLGTNSEALIKQVKAILNIYKTNDLWDELSDYQKACIKEAKQEIAKGKGIPHKEAMKKYKKWLTK